MSAAAPTLQISRLHKHFGAHHVLRGIDLTVEAGQVVCVLGPSGSGKTTLLRCINHLESFTEGSIKLNGEELAYERQHGRRVLKRDRDLARARAQVGFVFQQFNLFGHMTALENITCGPRQTRGLSQEAADSAGRALLAQVGLADREGAYPHQLSGGQQQRVAIARALAMEPVLLLFDEPTSALDPERVGEVLAVMRSVAAKGSTMIVATHEIGFAKDVGDVAVFMDGGEIAEQGPARETLGKPRTARLGQFLGQLQA